MGSQYSRLRSVKKRTQLMAPPAHFGSLEHLGAVFLAATAPGHTVPAFLSTCRGNAKRAIRLFYRESALNTFHFVVARFENVIISLVGYVLSLMFDLMKSLKVAPNGFVYRYLKRSSLR